jgi:hypothetical protein
MGFQETGPTIASPRVFFCILRVWEKTFFAKTILA